MHVCQTYILAHTYIRTLSVCFTYVNCSVRMYVLHVYARICTYIRQQILIRAYTYIYVHTFIYGYTCIYVHIHAYTCIRSYTRIHAYTCNTCIYVHIHAYMHIRKLKTYTCNIRAYMASICTYMHVYCTYITLFYIFWAPRRGRGSLPAEGHRPVQRALKKVSKTMQNAFDVFRSRTPVFQVRSGNLYHYAILADMYMFILAVYIPYFNLYVHICTYVHIRAYTYIEAHIPTDTCIYVRIRAYTYIIKHHQIAVGRCFGGEAADVFWTQCEILPSRSAVMGHEAVSQCSDMARGTAQHGRGGCKRGTGRVRRGCAK